MSNPYDDFKKEKGLVKYLCNKCKNEMVSEYFSETQRGMDAFSSAFGMAKGAPSAFYCKNNKCDRFGLLTKVAIKS